jgi:hypothetical protein
VSEAASWCGGGSYSNKAEYSSWETGDTTPPADWFSPGDFAGGTPRYDFMHSPKDYGAVSVSNPTFGGAVNIGTSTRWIGSMPAGQSTGYFRYRFRGWKTCGVGQVTARIAAYNTFSLYFDGALVGSGSTPGQTYEYSLTTTCKKEHLIAVKVDKPGGGNAFALQIH